MHCRFCNNHTAPPHICYVSQRCSSYYRQRNFSVACVAMYAARPSPLHFCKSASTKSVFERSKYVVICWCERCSLLCVRKDLGFQFSLVSALAAAERVQESSLCEANHIVSICVRLEHKFYDARSRRGWSMCRPKQIYNFPTTYVTVIPLFSSSRALIRSTRPPFLKWSDSPSGLYVQRLS